MFVFDNVSHNKPSTLSLGQLFLAGAASGTANSILSGPIEHIRTRLQVQNNATAPDTYKGPVDLVKRVFAQHGIAGIYKGQGITITREFFGYGMYFLAYEWLIQRDMEKNQYKRNQVSIWKQMMVSLKTTYCTSDLLNISITKYEEDIFSTSSMELLQDTLYGSQYTQLTVSIEESKAEILDSSDINPRHYYQSLNQRFRLTDSQDHRGNTLARSIVCVKL